MKKATSIHAPWAAATALLAVLLLAACGQKSEEQKMAEPESNGKSNSELLLPGDSTIYGLACEGCNDSVVVLLPGDGGDPVTYDIVNAHRQHHVMGKLMVGDWIGLVRNPKDSTVADFVVNLDQLKGTWCYVVMPKWRDADNPFQGARANMSQKDLDSLKSEYFIPREYGFSLKRQWTAQSVGYVRQNALQSESPVVYPQLLYFTEWHILNGRLVMTSGEFRKTGKNEAMEVVNNRQDTCDMCSLPRILSCSPAKASRAATTVAPTLPTSTRKPARRLPSNRSAPSRAADIFSTAISSESYLQAPMGPHIRRTAGKHLRFFVCTAPLW